MPAITLVFTVVSAVGGFVIAAVTIGREARRLDAVAPRAVWQLEEAVEFVAAALPAQTQSRLTPDELRELLRAHVAWLARQPTFDLAICLHEDWESHGFYLYEVNPDHAPSRAEAVIAAVRPRCPVDASEVIEGRPAVGGVIRPDIQPATRPDWPEALYLVAHKTRHSYTLEAPSDFPLATRVAALTTAVRVLTAAPTSATPNA